MRQHPNTHWLDEISKISNFKVILFTNQVVFIIIIIILKFWEMCEFKYAGRK